MRRLWLSVSPAKNWDRGLWLPSWSLRCRGREAAGDCAPMFLTDGWFLLSSSAAPNCPYGLSVDSRRNPLGEVKNLEPSKFNLTTLLLSGIVSGIGRKGACSAYGE